MRAAAAALVLLTASNAFAIGAIAVDDDVGAAKPGYGAVVDRANKDAAKRDALQQCRDAGNKSCKFVAWFETCGAYAVTRKFYGAGWGRTKADAEAMALQKCGAKGCRIAISLCEEVLPETGRRVRGE